MKRHYLIILFLGISLFFNLFGIQWGLPVHWYPDEYETIEMTVIPMARNLDPNPHYFLKPSFYYYLLCVIMLPYFIYMKVMGIQIESYQNFIGTVTLIARIATALIGVLGVYMVYLIGKCIRDKNAGLISAGLLAVTLGYASYAHFAYYDVPMITIMLISVYLCFRYVKLGELSFLYWGGFIGGLAFSTKYNALFFVGLVLFICYLYHIITNVKNDLSRNVLLSRIFSKPLFFVIGLFIIGFIVGTPFSILDFRSFFNGVIEQFFTTKDIKGFQGSGMWLSNISHFKSILGLPLGVLLFGTFLYGIYGWVKKPNFAGAILIFVPLISFIYISTWHISAIRYILPIVPFLLLLAGICISDSIRGGKITRTLSLTVLGIVAIYTVGFTWKGIRCFSSDTREAATQWIEENIKSDNKVEVYAYLSYLPRFPEYIQLNRINPNYIPLSVNYETFKKSDLGQKLTRKEEYKHKKDHSDNRSAFTSQALEDRNPDYIVLSSFYYQRYLNDDHSESQLLCPELSDYFKQLVNGMTGYRTVKVFENLNSGMEGYFLNPTISILKKV